MIEKTALAFTWEPSQEPNGAMICRDRRGRTMYEPGKTYRLVEENGRSKRSHDHQFAVIEEAWRHIPEAMAERLPSPLHFRKYLLIKCGYCETKSIVCESRDEAAKLAALLKTKGFSVIDINARTVTEYVAESQSMKEMGPKRFQESKQAIFELAAQILGITLDELVKNTGAAA